MRRVPRPFWDVSRVRVINECSFHLPWIVTALTPVDSINLRRSIVSLILGSNRILAVIGTFKLRTRVDNIWESSVHNYAMLVTGYIFNRLWFAQQCSTHSSGHREMLRAAHVQINSLHEGRDETGPFEACYGIRRANLKDCVRMILRIRCPKDFAGLRNYVDRAKGLCNIKTKSRDRTHHQQVECLPAELNRLFLLQT